MRTESSSEEYAREVITKQSSYTPIVLSEGDTLSICEKLISVSRHWSTLGLAFGVKASELMDIEDQYRSNTRCLMEMVGKRLQRTDPKHLMTWPYICECLRRPTVKLSDVAEEIEGKVPSIATLFNTAFGTIYF